MMHIAGTCSVLIQTHTKYIRNERTVWALSEMKTQNMLIKQNWQADAIFEWTHNQTGATRAYKTHDSNNNFNHDYSISTKNDKKK